MILLSDRPDVVAPAFWGLDAIPSPIAVLDTEGVIVAVNEAWVEFGKANGLRIEGGCVGANYLAICDAAGGEAVEMGRAIREMAAGLSDPRSVEYPCHSAELERHFIGRVSRFEVEGRVWIMVAHEDVTARRSAEHRLRNSEARFRSLIENATGIISIVDEQGLIRYESPSTEGVFGYEHTARLGKSFFDFIAPGDRDRVRKSFDDLLRGQVGRVPLECRYLGRAGEWRVIEGTAKNLVHDPSIEGVVVNFRDVSDRKRAELGRERLAAVMDSTPNLVCLANSEGEVEWMNRAFRGLLGLREGEDLPRVTLSDLHPPWASDRLLHEVMPTVQSSGVWSGETCLATPSGVELPVLQVVVAHGAQGGDVDFYSVTAHDIAERRRAEADLKESQEIFRQIAENIAEVLWIFDLDCGRPVYVSPGHERVWGRTICDDSAEPEAFLASVLPRERTRVDRPVNAKATRGQEEIFQIVRPDGTPRWLRAKSFPIRDARGSVSRIVGITEDVTEKRRMEGELRQAQRMEAIGSLAAGIAHEINTPIQYVGDNLQFLRDSFEDLGGYLTACNEVIEKLEGKADAEDAIARIRQASAQLDLAYVLEEVPRAAEQSIGGVERVAEIVRAMREFSHPGGAEKTTRDLNQIVRDTVTVARHEWRYVADIEYELDEALPPVPCHAGELSQAVLNILINATHAIADKAGQTDAERGTLTISTRRDGHYVELQIEDTGVGIPEEIRPRIFDLFFTTKEVGRGTGQGLTLAHSVIVDRHGGSIAVESEVGKGSTFLIRLPLDLEEGRPS